jgi:hypothetical protein
MWYHCLELNDGPPPWNHFVQLLQIRFGSSLTTSSIDDLTLLQREGLVDDYCSQFMALSCHDSSIIEDHQVQIFVAGLGHPLRTDFALQRPLTLDEAVMYARAYEQRALPPSAPPPQKSASCFFSKPPPQPSSHLAITVPTSSAASVQGKPTIPTLCLTLAKNAQCRKDVQCFHCNELFSRGHKELCQHLFMIEVTEELTDTDEESQFDGDPTISVHALNGI